MSQTPVNFLQQQLADCLLIIEKLEKQLVKTYLKMEKAAHADELAKCLSPVSTDSEQHAKRLQLIKSLINQKPAPTGVEETMQAITLKKASAEQDVGIIYHALKLQNAKLAHYEFMHALTLVLSLDAAAELIEQTITDNRNTNTWLRQIMQNVLVKEFS